MKMCFSYFSSVAQLYPILCDPMHRSTPGLSVHHKLLEFTQTHAHRVSDAIQPSLSLSPPSPPAPNPSQHQGLFQWVNSSHEVAKVLELCLHRAKKCDNFLIMPSSPSFLKLFLFIKLIYFSYCCSVTQLIQTFYNPMDCSPSGSSVCGILQARILERVVIPSSRSSSWPRDWTSISWVSCIGKQVL